MIIQGLQTKTDFNEKIAQIVDWDAKKKRYLITMSEMYDDNNKRVSVSVCEDNIREAIGSYNNTPTLTALCA